MMAISIKTRKMRSIIMDKRCEIYSLNWSLTNPILRGFP
jgi:hypothetical protein